MKRSVELLGRARRLLGEPRSRGALR